MQTWRQGGTTQQEVSHWIDAHLASYGKDARGLVRDALAAYVHTERQKARKRGTAQASQRQQCLDAMESLFFTQASESTAHYVTYYTRTTRPQPTYLCGGCGSSRSRHCRTTCRATPGGYAVPGWGCLRLATVWAYLCCWGRKAGATMAQGSKRCWEIGLPVVQ